VTKRALVVSTASPYPVVTNGCARLVSDYERRMFTGHDVWFLAARPGAWTPVGLFHDGREVPGAALDVDAVVARRFDFALFIGFHDNPFTRALATALPSFCLTDTFPHPDVPGHLFRGILSHRLDGGGLDCPDVLLVGGSLDDEVFRPARVPRSAEDLVLSVGRIHPDKGQLDLVRSYREQVFEPYGLPLHLVGGVDHPDYYDAVAGHVDGVSVISTVDAERPSATSGWLPAREIAELCNRARLFVSPSPHESFGMALIEAMACGTTCVVNGQYSGFAEADLRLRVHGNITRQEGSIVDLVAQALADDVRIDGSDWAMQYSVNSVRPAVAQFVEAHL